ncbi:mercuric reductase [Reyranella sp.]|jgi:mercuric ion transport protein|uniref:mercuric reductase n=1 Tax=Reyranella sp. TaxID=1929291 RepID=UPI003BAB1FAD
MMESQTTESASSDRQVADTAKTFLTAGGLLAAFGLASCCALPVALSLLGISAASLVGISYLAAQYQQELLYGAVICLGAAAFIMWWQRRARLCAPDATCNRPTVDWGNKIALVLAVGLLALTFWIAPPI